MKRSSPAFSKKKRVSSCCGSHSLQQQQLLWLQLTLTGTVYYCTKSSSCCKVAQAIAAKSLTQSK
jgi:hypothetical protein